MDNYLGKTVLLESGMKVGDLKKAIVWDLLCMNVQDVCVSSWSSQDELVWRKARGRLV